MVNRTITFTPQFNQITVLSSGNTPQEATCSDAYYIDKGLFTNSTTVNSNAAYVINTALLAARAEGKNFCVVPEGEYWLTETIYLKDGVILKGCGMDATTLKIADDCDIDAIRVAGPINNSGIMDLTIDGNRIRNYSVFANGHHGNAINVWLHYGRIERVRTNWVFKHGLLLNYDTGNSDDGLGFEPEHQNDMGNLNKVLWCDFRDSLLQGVMWGWRTMDSWMCYTNIGSHAANLYLEGGTSRFIGNHFDGDGDNGAGPEYNVYCGDGCKAMLFESNIFENTQKENIYFRQPSYSNETKTISIVNNIIRTCSKKTNNTYANIYISGYSALIPAAQIIICGNQILNPDTEGNHGSCGIHLDYCSDVKIIGNEFFNVGSNHTVIENTCTNIINDDTMASSISSISLSIANMEGDIADLQYVPIDISSFSNSVNQAEIGSTVNSVILSYAINKTPTSATLDGTAKTISQTNGSISLTNISLTLNKTWTLSVTDERSATSTKTTTLSFLYKAYYGAATAPDTINSSFLLGLANGALTSSRQRTFNVNAGANQYIWYAVPASFGSCTFTVGGFTGGFTKVDTITHTNASGVSASYDVYKSDNMALGETTVIVS